MLFCSQINTINAKITNTTTAALADFHLSILASLSHDNSVDNSVVNDVLKNMPGEATYSLYDLLTVIIGDELKNSTLVPEVLKYSKDEDNKILSEIISCTTILMVGELLHNRLPNNYIFQSAVKASPSVTGYCTQTILTSISQIKFNDRTKYIQRLAVFSTIFAYELIMYKILPFSKSDPFWKQYISGGISKRSSKAFYYTTKEALNSATKSAFTKFNLQISEEEKDMVVYATTTGSMLLLQKVIAQFVPDGKHFFFKERLSLTAANGYDGFLTALFKMIIKNSTPKNALSDTANNAISKSFACAGMLTTAKLLPGTAKQIKGAATLCFAVNFYYYGLWLYSLYYSE